MSHAAKLDKDGKRQAQRGAAYIRISQVQRRVHRLMTRRFLLAVKGE
jgi:hypothetical protein